MNHDNKKTIFHTVFIYFIIIIKYNEITTIMPLESTMICLDNSEWMRNGDHIPSRLDAQQDAVTMLVRDR